MVFGLCAFRLNYQLFWVNNLTAAMAWLIWPCAVKHDVAGSNPDHGGRISMKKEVEKNATRTVHWLQVFKIHPQHPKHYGPLHNQTVFFCARKTPRIQYSSIYSDLPTWPKALSVSTVASRGLFVLSAAFLASPQHANAALRNHRYPAAACDEIRDQRQRVLRVRAFASCGPETCRSNGLALCAV